MYDTKTRELRWNATYFDYAASLPEDDVDYSKCPGGFARRVALMTRRKRSLRRKSWIFFEDPLGPRSRTSWTCSEFFSSQC